MRIASGLPLLSFNRADRCLPLLFRSVFVRVQLIVKTFGTVQLISVILFCFPFGPLVVYVLVRTERDGALWNLDHQEVQRRRRLFWEMYTWDSWVVSSILALSFSLVKPFGVLSLFLKFNIGSLFCFIRPGSGCLSPFSVRDGDVL